MFPTEDYWMKQMQGAGTFVGQVYDSLEVAKARGLSNREFLLNIGEGVVSGFRRATEDYAAAARALEYLGIDLGEGPAYNAGTEFLELMEAELMNMNEERGRDGNVLMHEMHSHRVF